MFSEQPHQILMPAKSQSGLKVIHNLYLMQVDLEKLIKTDLADPQDRKQAKAIVTEFSKLLAKADPDFMGGEDVLQGLRETAEEAREKLKKVRS